MGEAGILLMQLITMFLYVGVGWCLCRAKLVTEANSAALTNLLLYVVIPCVIVQSFYREASPETTLELLMSLGLSALGVGLAMAVTFLVFRKRPAANFGSSFSNAGFMGIPLITAVVGESAVFYIAGFVALLNILQWTYGQAILGASREELKPLALVRNPLILAFFVGLLLYFLPITLPSLVENAIGAIAGCNAPVAMVVLGVLLGNISPRKMFLSGEAWAVSGVRLLRAVRRAVPHRDWLVSLEDGIYWIFDTAFIFGMLYRETGGLVRGYVILPILAHMQINS